MMSYEMLMDRTSDRLRELQLQAEVERLAAIARGRQVPPKARLADALVRLADWLELSARGDRREVTNRTLLCAPCEPVQ